jgi:hypothetical protein
MSITNSKEQFIKNIINDPICIPSKSVKEILNANWQSVDTRMLYAFIVQSMHSLKDKFHLLTNLLKFVDDDDFRRSIKAFIVCRKYEYAEIKKTKNSTTGEKYIYNVYSMAYHEDQIANDFEAIADHQGRCNKYIGAASTLELAQRLAMLDRIEYEEDEDENDTGYQLFYRVSKTNLACDIKLTQPDCSYGELFFDKRGNLIDIFMYDFQIDDSDTVKYPIADLNEDYDYCKISHIAEFMERFAKDQKVKVYNSIYSLGLCDAKHKKNYIIGYLNDPAVASCAMVRSTKSIKNRHDYEFMPIQYIDL